MAEGDGSDGPSHANASGIGGGGPSVRGGPSSGATKLTDSAGGSSQSCQC
jgi:hypothetical protein